MNLRKAISFLRQLADSGTYDLDAYSKAHALLAGFYDKNRDSNGIKSDLQEKIDDVEIYFQIICGLGEDGFTEEKARKNLLSSIDKLEINVSDGGLGLSSHR